MTSGDRGGSAGHSAELSSPVQLYVYDLSRGMARTLSLAYLGTHIEAIWHTSIVVYGNEYYFGQGICVDPPGQTPHGHPQEIIDMGTTNLPRSVFLEYIDNLQSVYTPDRYHLLDNNCNSFTNDVCQFLLEKPIPQHITSLPQDFIQTPMGRMLEPLIRSFFGPTGAAAGSSVGTHSASHALAQTTSPPVAQLSSLNIEPRETPPNVSTVQLTSMEELQQHLGTHRVVILYFYSKPCRPCEVIAPEFDRLVKTYGLVPRGSWDANTAGLSIVKVDIGASASIALSYSVMAAPTFITILSSQKVKEVKGANVAQLERAIKALMEKAYPIHPHSQCTLQGSPRESPSILFKQAPQPAAIIRKITEIGQEIHIDAHQLALLSSLEGALASGDYTPPDAWQTLMDAYFANAAPSKLFPVIDLVRLLVLKPSVQTFYSLQDYFALWKIVHDFGIYRPPPAEPVPVAAAMMSARLACNLFSLEPTKIVEALFGASRLTLDFETTKDTFTPATLLIRVLTSHLTSQDFWSVEKSSLRKAIGALAWNLSRELALHRLRHRGFLSVAVFKQVNGIPVEKLLECSEHGQEDEWMELVTALVHAIGQSHISKVSPEERVEVQVWLVTALVWTIYFAPGEGADEILQVLEWPAILQELESSANGKSSTLVHALADARMLTHP